MIQFEKIDEKILNLFKKIYLYYGKEFPIMPFTVFLNEWEDLLEYPYRITWEDKIEGIIAHEHLDENINKFTEEFIEWVGENAA